MGKSNYLSSHTSYSATISLHHHNTPKPLILEKQLSSYPNQNLVLFFLKGISTGFRIGYQTHAPNLHSCKNNLQGALSHLEVVEEYLQTEIELGRVAGPCASSELPATHISRFGVTPKRNQPGKWRLIIDLSYPKGHIINDGISKPLCELHYVTIDEAIDKIVQLGNGSLLAKIDIRSTFPIHPADHHLLAMRWNNSLYIDTCLPFGLRSAPKLFNILADQLYISREYPFVFTT